MYSQNNEEQFILEHFGSMVGRFLDIGAFDGKTFSNTLALVERNWTGVCVEPSPPVFASLLKLHGGNPNIKLVNAAVSDTARLQAFYDSGGDAISSLSTAHVDKWSRNAGTKFMPFLIHTITLPMIFEQFGYNFDFVNLDVEGLSYQLFTALPLDKLAQTTLLCVEHDGNVAPACQLAAQHGYRVVTSNPENLIFAR